MWRYVAGVLALLLLASGGAVLYQRTTIANQKVELTTLTRERDNLKSELATAQVRLQQAQKAQVAAADALSRARAAELELAAVKDWIRGNEDAPIPDWFVDLLVRIGFSVRDPADRGQN